MDEIKFQKYLESQISVEELNSILTVPNDFSLQGDYLIKREHLIKICDEYLANKISNEQIETIAFELIGSEYFDWNSTDIDGEIVAETLFCWDSPEINFELNERNMQLWKKYLETGENKLRESNIWNEHIEKQKEICSKYSAQWTPMNPKLRVGISKNLDSEPINGLRHPSEKGTTGWFIWTGEYEDRDDFFRPMCAEHLLKYRPEIIKYLCFPYLA